MPGPARRQCVPARAGRKARPLARAGAGAALPGTEATEARVSLAFRLCSILQSRGLNPEP
jgi:hypothetical protein